MRYAYRNLGNQEKGATVIVRWRGGSPADVMLLDPVNFSKYRDGRLPVAYSDGGRYRRPPAELTIPEEGRWYVVADLRGYSELAEATVEMPPPEGHDKTRQERLLTAA